MAISKNKTKEQKSIKAIVTQSIDGEEEHYLKNIVYHHENKVIYERATN